MGEYEFFSQDPAQWGDALQSIWGHHDICPLLGSFHTTAITQSKLSSLTSLKTWGEAERFKSKVAFLLVSTKGPTEGDKVFGLTMIWVHLYQARVPSMGEAVKLLTPLPSTTSDCSYALVQFIRDTCHALLPKEGQLSGPGCRRHWQCHLQKGHSTTGFCQLLSSGSQVIYPAGLNGCDVLLITSPPVPMAKGINLLGSDPIYLKVDIPPSNMEGPELKALPLSSHSPSTLVASPIRPPPPKVEGEVSMTMEVRELLSWMGLNMSEHASGSSTPKRWELVVLVTPFAHQAGRP